MATRAQTPVPTPLGGRQSGVEALADAVAALGDGGPAEAPARLLAGVGESLGADVMRDLVKAPGEAEECACEAGSSPATASPRGR